MKKIIQIMIIMLLAVFTVSCGSSTAGTGVGTLGDDNKKSTATPTVDDTQSTPKASSTPKATATPDASLKLTTYDGDFFTVSMPKGWKIYTSGSYVSFGFRMVNPNNTSMQIFRYGALAPFLKSNDALNFYNTYYPNGPLAGAPVLTDWSAGGLLGIWNDCISYQVKTGSQLFPTLSNLSIISNQSYYGSYSAYGASESIATASANCEGNKVQTILSTAVANPGSTYANGIDTSYLILYETVGIIAPVGTSSEDIASMMQCATSIAFTESYINDSLADSNSSMNSVSAQLSINRALMDNLQSQWLSYIDD